MNFSEYQAIVQRCESPEASRTALPQRTAAVLEFLALGMAHEQPDLSQWLQEDQAAFVPPSKRELKKPLCEVLRSAVRLGKDFNPQRAVRITKMQHREITKSLAPEEVWLPAERIGICLCVMASKPPSSRLFQEILQTTWLLGFILDWQPTDLMRFDGTRLQSRSPNET